jgi:hypothetical protein
LADEAAGVLYAQLFDELQAAGYTGIRVDSAVCPVGQERDLDSAMVARKRLGALTLRTYGQ